MKCLTCGHTLKHHKQSGRCRKTCRCDIAALKHEFKRKRDALTEVRRKASELARV
jgi:hypothetical protein